MFPASRRFAAVSNRDSLDWKGISASEIQERVVNRVQPGSIVLFHNAAKHTPEALPGILETLIGQGYTIVPISKLVYSGTCGVDYTIDHTGKQIPAAVGKNNAGSDQSTDSKSVPDKTDGTKATEGAQAGDVNGKQTQNTKGARAAQSNKTASVQKKAL